METLTTDEKVELVERIRGPKKYTISVWGYGGECAYGAISKQAYDFWQGLIDEHGDWVLVDYMTHEYSDIEELFVDNELEGLEIPAEADFMRRSDGLRFEWYDTNDQIDHYWGLEYEPDELHVTIEDEDDCVFDGTLDELNEEIYQARENSSNSERADDPDDYTDYTAFRGAPEDTEYMFRFFSSEKGTFINGEFESLGEFNPEHLRFQLEESALGEEILSTIVYQGVEIDSDGGDSIGKGYSAELIKI